MSINKSLCKTCGNVVSFEAKTCPACGDKDPFNKRAIKSTAYLLKTKYNTLYGIFMVLILILIIIIFKHYCCTKSWYMILVFPFVGVVGVEIITKFSKVKVFDDNYYFFDNRLRLSELIKISIENFIEANCKELNKQCDLLSKTAYLDVLRMYLMEMDLINRISILDTFNLGVYDTKQIINDKIKSCIKNANR